MSRVHTGGEHHEEDRVLHTGSSGRRVWVPGRDGAPYSTVESGVGRRQDLQLYHVRSSGTVEANPELHEPTDAGLTE
jgi:hypothetical protein